jgi:hypothetical protein
MPPAFERCTKKKGSKIRTKKLSDGGYIHVCIPPGGGPSVAGEPKKVKVSEGHPGRVNQHRP